MDKEKSKQPGNDAFHAVEDLTVNETDATNVKGGPFSWGVEREMKESGEGI